MKKKTKKAQKKKKVVRAKMPKTLMVRSPLDPTMQFAVASEMADDSIIEKELMGEILPFYIYQFDNDGKKVSGLTVKGVNEVTRRLNRQKNSGYKIRISPNHIKIDRDVEYDGQKGVEVSVYAENMLDGSGAWGMKFEPYKKAKRDGSTYSNTFASEKALSKAERNAKRKLIPETTATKMIEQLIKMGGGQHVQKLDAPQATYQPRTVIQQPVKSEKQELHAMILEAIARAKTVDNLLSIDDKTQASTQLDPAFKKQVSQACKAKANQIEAKNG
jgi:hypothetical protein